jgi:hypothetical protein
MTNALKLAAASGIENDPYFANVSLLLHGDGTNGAQNNTFIDSSSNNYSITGTYRPIQGIFSPFSTSGEYSASTQGGSVYFDGGNYLSAPAGVSTISGNWTCEFFVYPKSNTGGLFGDFSSNSGTSFGMTMINGSIYFFGKYPNSSDFTFSCSGTVSSNTWSHIAVVWNQTTWKVYLNGNLVGSVEPSGTVLSGNSFDVGRGKGYYLTGFISNFRVLSGTALYTSNFTPPAAPLAAITNTKLLLSFTNAAIIDHSRKNNVDTVGHAQISTTNPKFGTGSILFDGSGDGLVIPNTNTNFDFGSGDFTVECFLYQNSDTGSGVLFAKRPVNGFGPFVIFRSNLNFASYITSNGSSWDISSGTPANVSITAGSWNHIAIVRYGSNFKIYVNGVGTTIGTSSAALYSVSNKFSIGAEEDGTTNPLPAGRIDEFRVTKGVARYIADFTPPPAPFFNK